MRILFPQHEINPGQVDEMYQLEYNAATTCGYIVNLYNHDEFVSSQKLISNLPLNTTMEPIILRGYMLKSRQYEYFYETLLLKKYRLVNDSHQYHRCHHSYESHFIFGNQSPKIMYFPNLSKEIFDRIVTIEFLNEKLVEMKRYFDSDFFILKDSVKSEKHIPELFKISIDITAEELLSRLKLFIEKRGKSYNDGLVFKEFVDLKKYSSNKINEWRIFVFRGKIISCSQNSELHLEDVKIPSLEWIETFTNKIQSDFFTIDVAEKSDGSWTIIETGDGQVSGLSPGQNELEFYNQISKYIPSHFFTI